jgi:hypothetical protein
VSEPFASADVAIVRHNRWIAAFTLGLLGLGVGAIALALATHTLDILDPALGVGAMGVMASLYAWYENPRPREIAGALRADASAVSFNGAPLLKRAAIDGGFIAPRDGRPPLVKLVRRGPFPSLFLRVQDEAEGRRLLGALGLGPAEVEVEFRLPSPVAASPFRRTLIAGGAILMSILGESVARSLAPGVLTVSIALRVSPFLAGTLFLMFSRLIVCLGARRLRVVWLGSERSIPYGEVQGVTRSDNEDRLKNPWMGLELRLTSGEQIRIPVAPLFGWGGIGIDAVEQRLREAMRAHARSDRQ